MAVETIYNIGDGPRAEPTDQLFWRYRSRDGVKLQPPADTGPIYNALSLVYREPSTD